LSTFQLSANVDQGQRSSQRLCIGLQSGLKYRTWSAGAWALNMSSKTTSSSTSNVPVRKECTVPGKAIWTIGATTFEIDDKYTPIKTIGKGAYGVVCSAKTAATGEKVAIKKIANAFENLTDARRTLREIMLLRLLKHDNVIAVKDILKPPSKEKDKFNDVYLVYELMDTDLHQIIRSSQALTNEHFQFFVYQILRGLKYVHSANVLHRDLKPSNLLLTASCDLKICDFGLARTSTERNFMTEYVVTRWYRAPELLLSCDNYTAAIDVWSVGCILAEMLAKKPLFPGRNYMDQMQCVLRVLGRPSDDDIGFMSTDKLAQVKSYLWNLAPPEKVSLHSLFPGADPLAIDLMQRMLTFDPRKRITVADALAHPWLKDLHNEAEEPSAPVRFDLDFEDQYMSDQMVRDKVWAEVLQYHPHLAEQPPVPQSQGWAPQQPQQQLLQPVGFQPPIPGFHPGVQQQAYQQGFQPPAQFGFRPPMQPAGYQAAYPPNYQPVYQQPQQAHMRGGRQQQPGQQGGPAS